MGSLSARDAARGSAVVPNPTQTRSYVCCCAVSGSFRSHDRCLFRLLGCSISKDIASANRTRSRVVQKCCRDSETMIKLILRLSVCTNDCLLYLGTVLRASASTRPQATGIWPHCGYNLVNLAMPDQRLPFVGQGRCFAASGSRPEEKGMRSSDSMLSGLLVTTSRGCIRRAFPLAGTSAERSAPHTHLAYAECLHITPAEVLFAQHTDRRFVGLLWNAHRTNERHLSPSVRTTYCHHQYEAPQPPAASKLQDIPSCTVPKVIHCPTLANFYQSNHLRADLPTLTPQYYRRIYAAAWHEARRRGVLSETSTETAGSNEISALIFGIAKGVLREYAEGSS